MSTAKRPKAVFCQKFVRLIRWITFEVSIQTNYLFYEIQSRKHWRWQTKLVQPTTNILKLLIWYFYACIFKCLIDKAQFCQHQIPEITLFSEENFSFFERPQYWPESRNFKILWVSRSRKKLCLGSNFCYRRDSKC